MFIAPGPSLTPVNGDCEPGPEVVANGQDSEADANHVTTENGVHVDDDISERLNGDDHGESDHDVKSSKGTNMLHIESPESGRIPSTTQSSQERLSTVILRGYQHKVEEAKSKLEGMIKQQLEQVTEELCIPAEVRAVFVSLFLGDVLFPSHFASAIVKFNITG